MNGFEPTRRLMGNRLERYNCSTKSKNCRFLQTNLRENGRPYFAAQTDLAKDDGRWCYRTTEPGFMNSVCVRNRAEGFSTGLSPVEPISKIPSSFAGPKRFLIVRTIRCGCCRGPSKYKTVSTMCSRAFGPAIEPSFVMCP